MTCSTLAKELRKYLQTKCLTWPKNFHKILVFSEDNDLSEIRNFETPSREKILTNLEHFLQNQCEHIERLPRKESLYHELKNLKFHIERGRLSGLSPGGGTENNERLHCYLNRSFLRGASVISLELAGAILAVIFYAYNAR